MIAINASRWLPLAGLCLIAIGCGGDGVGALVAQLDGGAVDQRRAAARELGERAESDERVIAVLTKGVADADAEVRHWAIRALGRRGPAALPSIPALEKSLTDVDGQVRVQAALAIAKIDPDNRTFVPELNAAMRAGQGRILLEIGAMGKDAEWAVPTLVALLSHEAPQMRALAAQTLGRIGPAAGDASAALERVRQDPNPAVRGAAGDALERVRGGERAR